MLQYLLPLSRQPLLVRILQLAKPFASCNRRLPRFPWDDATRSGVRGTRCYLERARTVTSHNMSSSQPNASSSAFAQLDTDQSGFLGREEIRAAVAARGLPSAHVQAFIDAADHDGDGRISLGEFLRFCDQREAQLHSVFTRLDRNGDGRLTGEEIRAGCDALGVRVSHEQQRGLMQRLDANGDGGVSFDEFRSLLLLLPEVNPVAVIEAFQLTRTLAHPYPKSTPSPNPEPNPNSNPDPNQAFQLTAHIEHAEGACTPPPERNAANQSLMQALLAKLWAGGVAGAVSRTATAPIDRIKTMMQVAPSGGGGGGMAVVRAIQQEGGVAAFWRGNTANVLKIAPETAIKFIAFDSLKGAVARDPATATAAERFVAGGAAGAIAQAVCPLEIPTRAIRTMLYLADDGCAYPGNTCYGTGGHIPYGGRQDAARGVACLGVLRDARRADQGRAGRGRRRLVPRHYP